MNENTPLYVSSVVRNNHFTRRFTHLTVPTVWLEASKNPETKSWSVHAMGTSERDRNNGLQNLTPAFLNNIPGITKPPQLPSMNSISNNNGYRITSYESNLLASGLTERKALAYLVFFERENGNFQEVFKNYIKVDFETVARLKREDSTQIKEKRFIRENGYHPRLNKMRKSKTLNP